MRTTTIFSSATPWWALSVSTLVVMAAACTSGGGSSSGNTTGDTTDTPAPPIAGTLNGPLSGTIIVDRFRASGSYAVDLATGDLSAHPGQKNHETVTSTDDGLVLFGITECDDINTDGDCFEIFKPNGDRIAWLTTGEDLLPLPPSVTDDGSKFILFGRSDRTYFKQIAGSPGNFRLEDMGTRSGVTHAHWGPGDSVYYTRGMAIYRADSVLLPREQDVLIHEFDNPDEGIPFNLSVHPDGSMIAVEQIGDFITGPDIASIWLINTDGSGGRRLITTSTPQGVRYPIWSPDGSYLLVVVGIRGENITGFASSGLVAFDPSYDQFEVRTIGSQAGEGRIVLHARSVSMPNDSSGAPRFADLAATPVTAWSPNALEFITGQE